MNLKIEVQKDFYKNHSIAYKKDIKEKFINTKYESDKKEFKSILIKAIDSVTDCRIGILKEKINFEGITNLLIQLDKEFEEFKKYLSKEKTIGIFSKSSEVNEEHVIKEIYDNYQSYKANKFNASPNTTFFETSLNAVAPAMEHMNFRDQGMVIIEAHVKEIRNLATILREIKTDNESLINIMGYLVKGSQYFEEIIRNWVIIEKILEEQRKLYAEHNPLFGIFRENKDLFDFDKYIKELRGYSLGQLIDKVKESRNRLPEKYEKWLIEIRDKRNLFIHKFFLIREQLKLPVDDKGMIALINDMNNFTNELVVALQEIVKQGIHIAFPKNRSNKNYVRNKN